MTTELEGGCLVIDDVRAGAPLVAGGLSIWRHVGRERGAEAISLRVLEAAPGRARGLRPADCEEVLYVLAGRGAVYLGGVRYRVDADTGLYVRPGQAVAIDADGPAPLLLASAQCPDPGPEAAIGPPVLASPGLAPDPAPLARLADRRRETTADRWYRVVIGRDAGCERITQFVGGIPPGRAPDHYHQYEEVLCVLAGEGRMWAGETSCLIRAGACVFLPRGQVHCVENTGEGELRLLGVFYPSGSPAVRYDAG